MRLQLGINTCFAVKRYPLPEEWAPIVRDELDLRLVQHSLDLVDLHAEEERLRSQADALRFATEAHDLELHSTFTGLAGLLGQPASVTGCGRARGGRRLVPGRHRLHRHVRRAGYGRTRWLLLGR